MKKPPVDMERVLARIRFQDLAVFEAVARLGSVAAAAREKKLNPPLISKTLKKIEKASGHSLFQRSNQGFRLTPEGLDFLTFHEQLASLLHRTSAAARVDEATVYTAVGSSFLVTHLLPEAFYRVVGYGDRHRYRLLNLSQDELVPQGIRGTFDLALHTQPLQWPRTWSSVPLGPLAWTLCGRTGHRLGRVTDEKRVRAERFVVPVHWSDRGFRRGEDKCPLPFRQRLLGDEAGTAETGLSLASRSDQLIFVPEIVARQWVGRDRIQTIEVKQWAPVRDTVYLSVHTERVSNDVFPQLTRVLSEILAGR